MGTPPARSILWRRLDRPGHEAARLLFQDPAWQLAGTAVFARDGEACCLDYVVMCDRAWRTTSAQVRGWLGDETIELDLAIDPARRWRLNGTEWPSVAGCLAGTTDWSPGRCPLLRHLRLPQPMVQERGEPGAAGGVVDRAIGKMRDPRLGVGQ